MIRPQTEHDDPRPPDNHAVADRLDELAGLLEAQQANRYRVRAYRTAAETVRALHQPAAEILSRDGIDGLTRLPGIGQTLARSIEQLTRTGGLALLNQLRGRTAVERVLETVAGIGPKTAAKIHHELGIETLAELEAAAYDGRLARLAGMGQKRIRAVQESLAGRFRRRPDPWPDAQRTKPADPPPVAELLSIDEEYRQKAQADRLPRIAPRRFNPAGLAWLSILHAHREGRHYTAMYSNTARAHELGTARDWVVIYRADHDGGGQWTVVTARFGELKGRRIVRGREAECAKFYAQRQSVSSSAETFARPSRFDLHT